MVKVTAEQYQAAIPACCELETVDEHVECLMLCWGLLSAIENKQKMECEGCVYKKKNSEEI